MDTRYCRSISEKGEPCRQRPLADGDLCFWHDPRYEQQQAEARRAGGLNRARDHTLRTVYDLAGVDSHEALQRIVEVATLGLLALENSVARNRALLAAAIAGAQLLEKGELARKLEEVREVLEPRRRSQKPRGRWFR